MNGGDFLRRHCLDLRAALAQACSAPPERRLARLLAIAGCPSHDAAGRLVAGASARLCAVGGIPMHALAAAGIGPDGVAALARETMGTAGAMSYLSLPGGSAGGAYAAVVEGHGHSSVAHAASVSILVAGVTCAVENEFNCQRDNVHMARVTEARTAVQSAPPVVVAHPSLAPRYARLLAAADAERAEAAREFGDGASGRDALEALNLMFPAAKATAFLLTGSLRGIQKVLAAEDDPGKEVEYRRTLALVRAPLSEMWPALFRGASPLRDEEPEDFPAPVPSP